MTRSQHGMRPTILGMRQPTFNDLPPSLGNFATARSVLVYCRTSERGTMQTVQRHYHFDDAEVYVRGPGRSMGDRVASSAAAAGRSRGACEQDGAHRLGGDAAREGIPAQGCGRLVAHGTGAGACERAMTRDGTVGRSDATERSLPFHWDLDPARMMRPRFADSIRASSPSGLREQAGHMTASDFCAARYIFSCQAGAIHT